MLNTSAYTTVVVIPSSTAHAHGASMLPVLRDKICDVTWHALPHPEQPSYVAGTTVPRLLYALGHDGQLPKNRGLQPQHYRQLRDSFYRTRKRSGRIHIVGVIDHDSPYGSRNTLEEVTRLVKQSRLPVSIHLGAWNPTPREFYRGLHEITSLTDNTTLLHSLFSLPQSPAFTSDRLSSHYDVWLPVLVSHVFVDQPFESADTLIVAGQWPYEWRIPLSMIAAQDSSTCVLDLMETETPSWALQVQHNRHTLTVTTDASHIAAYSGRAVDHPYYESMVVPHGSHMLEMLLSPHFGYGVHPYQTTVIVEQDHTPHFSTLLAQYLSHVGKQQPYCCVVLQPSSSSGNIVITNHPIDVSDSLYGQLHASAR